MVKSPHGNLHNEIQRFAEQAQAISRAVESSSLAYTRIAALVRANQKHWQSIIDQAAAASRAIHLTRAHSTWLRDLKEGQDASAKLQIAVKSYLGSMADRLASLEPILAGRDLKVIQPSTALPDLEIQRYQASVNAMMAAYGRVAAAIRSYSDITVLPNFALAGATREICVTGHTVKMLGISDVENTTRDSSEDRLIIEIAQETSVCATFLRAVHPDLARAHAGARAALRGDNPDRARHVMSSLRELWNHLLRAIAPDDQVLQWMPAEDEALMHEGKPTRRARVLYVCRDLNHEPLAAFVVRDTQALVAHIGIFNRVHELGLRMSDQHLQAILLRTESWITYIVQIWRETR